MILPDERFEMVSIDWITYHAGLGLGWLKHVYNIKHVIGKLIDLNKERISSLEI